MKTETKWALSDFYPGAHLRVKVGNFYHHGIYVGNNQVVQFGHPTDFSAEANDVRVLLSPIEDFSNGSQFVEVRQYSRKERKTLLANDTVVSNALSRVGEGNYDVLHNNCEHLANWCTFGVAFSEQVDFVRDDVLKLLGKK